MNIGFTEEDTQNNPSLCRQGLSQVQQHRLQGRTGLYEVMPVTNLPKGTHLQRGKLFRTQETGRLKRA